MQGSQEPLRLLAPRPKGYSTHHADAAIAMMEGYGFSLDPWQRTVLQTWMRTDRDGNWVSNTWGVSVPRQNGKNGALLVALAYMAAVMGLKILYTSHRLNTSREQFRNLLNFFGHKVGQPSAGRAELNALVTELRKTNGQEALFFRDPVDPALEGGRLDVSARNSGAGRGTTFDVLVIDEAQEYEPHEQAALEPAISAAASGDPVVIYMGTPPETIGERGAPFVNLRNAAIGGAPGIAWVEFAASGEVDRMSELELRAFIQDRTNWAKANPALGIRVKPSSVEAESYRMAPRTFARERLNMWPSPRESAVAAFTRDGWGAAAIESPSEDWPLLAVGLDMDPARTKVAIAMCVAAPWGTHVELAADAAFHEAGTEALVDWVWKRAKRRVPVVMDGFSPARSIEGHLRQRGIKACVLRADEYMQACMGFSDAISERAATHFDQEALNIAALRVVREPVGSAGQWKFKRVDLETDLSVIVATTCAWYGGIKIARPASKTGAGRKTSMGFAYA